MFTHPCFAHHQNTNLFAIRIDVTGCGELGAASADASRRTFRERKLGMGDVINLRKRRKKAEKEEEAARAAANRLTHGRTKAERLLEATEAEKRRRHLDAHHIDGGEQE